MGRKARRLLRDPRDRRDPAGALALRRLAARPAESEAAWSGKQQILFTYKKRPRTNSILVEFVYSLKDT
ncbi:hypothetical protein Bbad01_18390 [Bacillus badius]|nr:hypothetical protein Bbad01_18390 [Bacillus badius]